MIGGSEIDTIWNTSNKVTLRMLMETSEGDQGIIDDYINKLAEIESEYEIQLSFANDNPGIYSTVITEGDRKGMGSGGEYHDYIETVEGELERIGEMTTALSNPEDEWEENGDLSIFGDKTREEFIGKMDELNTEYIRNRAAMKKKKLTKESKKRVKAAKKNMKRRTRKLTKRKKKKTNNKSLKKEKKKMISEKEYKELIYKRQHNKKLSLSQRKKLDHALFVKYCSCVKHLKYDSKVKDYLEYPLCMSSIYSKRGFKSPKNITKKCKKFD
jgi:hypothetical protein